MYLLRTLVITICCGQLSVNCLAQQQADKTLADTFETHLKSSLLSYYKKYPVEKAYIHTNQDVYSSGETIWYKIYATAYGKPSALSGVIYVRLTDTAGGLVIQNKLPLIDGKAHGNIDIEAQLKTGWYKLSAFTEWMMNFGHEADYTQNVYILNTADTVVPVKKENSINKAYHIRFYPEGGDLIDGNISKVAFKAWDDDGLPTTISGVIKNGQNTTIEKLNTLHDGMGEVSIEALAGNTYSAYVNFPDNSVQKIPLPDAKPGGISMGVSQSANVIDLKLAFAGPEEKFSNCLLAAVQNNGKMLTLPLHLTRGMNLFELRNDDFNTGILRITIFDNKGIPVAERLLFINKHDIRRPALKADTLSFLPNARNTFSIALKDNTGRPVTANFSLSVNDGDAAVNENQSNIFSSLLLTPELKGTIYNPGYYFKSDDDSLASYLDLVMLTSGWRHFVWKNILNGDTALLKYPVERSQYLAGKILNYDSVKESRKQIKLIVINQDSSKFVGYISPDRTGEFILKNFNHAGLSELYVAAADEKNHRVKLQMQIMPSLDDSLKQTKGIRFNDNTLPVISGPFIADARNLAESNVTMLKAVNVKEIKTSATEKLVREHVSPLYQSANSFTLDLVDNPLLSGNIGIIDFIKGKFPGLDISGGDYNVDFSYQGQGVNSRIVSTNYTAPDPNQAFKADMDNDRDKPMPYFYVDESEVRLSDLKVISLENVALIRFLPPPVVSAPYGGGLIGAIMIYTKKYSDEAGKTNELTNFDRFIFDGYSVAREFAAPGDSGYNHSNTTATLCWNHDINTDNNGMFKLRFYNSTGAKKIRIIIQGMDNDGKLFFAEQDFQKPE
jgi:hypothetical protein